MKRVFTSFISPLLMTAALLSACSNNDSDKAGTAEATVAAADTVQITPADELRSKLSAYVRLKDINIGVAVICIETNDSLSVNGHERYAMMSVCKFPQAITLLHLVDKGKISANTKLRITKEDLKIPTHSSLQQDHPKVPFTLTIPEAFSYSIGQSDNVTSNVIFDKEGGPAAVEEYIHSLGITDIGVGTDYAHMRNDSLHKNWITPMAAAKLLQQFYAGNILSDSSRAMLWRAMVNAISGKDRLKGQLPGVVIGHKTGTSGRDSTNATTAFNDIGIMELPDGRHIAVAVFLANSKLPDEENAKIIADIGKMAWDEFSTK